MPSEPKLKIVRVELSEAMRLCGVDADLNTEYPNDDGISGTIYKAMVAASEPLTPEEIDGLCRKMWGNDPSGMWDDDVSADIAANPNASSSRYCEKHRDKDRTRMRAFLDRIAAKETTE